MNAPIEVIVFAIAFGAMAVTAGVLKYRKARMEVLCRVG